MPLFNSADRRKGRRNTARDAKRRALAERRKPLNIDHLNKEKLIEKTQEIYDWCVLIVVRLVLKLYVLGWFPSRRSDTIMIEKSRIKSTS